MRSCAQRAHTSTAFSLYPPHTHTPIIDGPPPRLIPSPLPQHSTGYIRASLGGGPKSGLLLLCVSPCVCVCVCSTQSHRLLSLSHYSPHSGPLLACEARDHMRGLQRVPRYRDPLVRNVARMLLRGLQEQHHATSSQQVELEVRLGSILAHARARQLDVPVAVASPALMDESARTVYEFHPGLSQPLLQGIQVALREAGLATQSDMHLPFMKADAVLLLTNAKRLLCRYHRLHGASPGKHADSAKAAASPRQAPVYNPLSLTHGITVLSAEHKRRLAWMDMCCPGWCADVRFALSSETSVPIELTDATKEAAVSSRCRLRACVPVGPFFSVQLTQSTLIEDVWWYPPHEVRSYLERGGSVSSSSSSAATTGTTTFGVGTVIPTPALLMPEKAAERTGWYGMGASNIEVEVEVNLPALLREWKRLYGGAAVSAYLSASGLVCTTCAGTALASDASLKPPLAMATGDDDTDMHAMLLAEREDPLLLRMAEEMMAVVQFLTKVRIAE
ncbi:hypothetical protein LSCM1_04843 [Leishmania martiniquensis]|uniref:mRNA 5'-phosphatase n=1 Tax=Leishmania martiniquensis TaxID=1580590 RepID=A0A836GXV6_9TRYP|nr:hypothetical protein LSCM1_04843 [Leishmania martiniquensis]